MTGRLRGLLKDSRPKFRGSTRFRIERHLGSGAKGVVYQAYDKARKEHVALKTLRHISPVALYHFKQEFRLLADITHPNLVVLYELISNESQWFFTMELIHGVSFLDYVRHDTPSYRPPPATALEVLSSTIVEDVIADDIAQAAESQRTGPVHSPVKNGMFQKSGQIVLPHLANKQAYDYDGVPKQQSGVVDYQRLRHGLRQLADGLNALHGNGFLHRDIKPSNIIVTRAGRVVVLDFGVVTNWSERDEKGRRIVEWAGTPAYMAPEQARRGGDVSPASDWYGFGVVLYEALSGQLPFFGEGVPILVAKQHGVPAEPRQINPSAPSDLCDLCMRLLNPVSTKRPTGADVADALSSSTRQTQRNLDRQRRYTTGPYAVSNRTTQFLGRKQHIIALRRAYALLEAGKQASVLVSGRSGMGKTMLVRHFLDGLKQKDNVVVLEGRCYEGESVPYKALDALVDSLCKYLLRLPRGQVSALLPPQVGAVARAFPVLERVPQIARMVADDDSEKESRSFRRRALGALKELLQRIAAKSKLVLFIDDMHWGDIDSAPLLAELISQTQFPLLFLTSYRSEHRETSDILVSLLGTVDSFRDSTAAHVQDRGDSHATDHIQELIVEPFDIAEATALAEELITAAKLDIGFVEKIAVEAKGNPYFVHELVRFLQSRGPSADLMDTTLDSAILGRVNELSDQARQLLQVVAVAGGRIPQIVAQNAADLNVQRHRAFSELRAAHFVRTMGAREFDFIESYHDRVREVVAGSLADQQRRSVHWSIATAFDSAPPDVRRIDDVYTVAHHFFYGFDLQPERAQRVFDANALACRTAANSYAYGQAYEFFCHARDIANEMAITTDVQFEQLAGQVAARNGRPDEAIQRYRRALDCSADPLTRSRIHFGITRTYLGQFEQAAQRKQIREALLEIGRDTPWRVARAIIVAAKTALSRRLFEEQRTEIEQKPVDIYRVIAQLYWSEGQAAFYQLDYSGFVYALFLLSLEPILGLEASPEMADWFAGVGLACSALRKPRASRFMFARAQRIADRMNNPTLVARVKFQQAMANHHLGNPICAAAELQQCLREYELWMENVDYVIGLADLSCNLMMRGFANEGLEWVRRGLELATHEGRFAKGHPFRFYAGPWLAMVGRFDEAIALMERSKKLIETSSPDKWRNAQYFSLYALIHVVTGRFGPQVDECLASYDTLKLPKRLPLHLRHAHITKALVALKRYEAIRTKATRKDCRSVLRKFALISKKHPTLMSHWWLAQAMFLRFEGKIQKARVALERAEQLANQTDNVWVLFGALCERARLHVASGETDDAHRRAASALNIALEQGWTCWIDDVRREFDLPEARTK